MRRRITDELFLFQVQVMTENRRELSRSDASTDLHQLFVNAFHRYSLPMSREGMISWFMDLICFQRTPSVERQNEIDILTRRFVGMLSETELTQTINVYNKYLNMMYNEGLGPDELNFESFHAWEEWRELQQTEQ